MQGYILISAKDDSRWLYIPDARIRVSVTKSSEELWRTHSFRIDGHLPKQEGNLILVSPKLSGYSWIGEVAVSEHAAAYVIENDTMCREALSTIARITMRPPDSDKESALLEIRSLLADLTAKWRSKFALGQEVGQELHTLITSIGGPQ